MGESFDIVIAGGGSAGCVLAERFSADPARRVLLIEAGGEGRDPRIRLPICYGLLFHHPRFNWRFHAEPEPALGGRAMYWPRGKALGGSSAINAMVWSRGLPHDYDDWREAGNPGWGWDDVAPVYAAIERRVAADGRVTGDGPMTVSDCSIHHHPVNRHFLAAAREIGLPLTADPLGDDPEGVGPYACSIRRGLRCSAADAFLRPAMTRRNLTVWTDARVLSVTLDGARATGVTVRRGRETTTVAARERVVLAAGAVGSPQLLQLSGVGPGAVLQEMGLPVRRALEAVGGGLQDHLAAEYRSRAKEPTLNQTLGTWRGRAGAALRYAATRGGPLGLSVNQIGGMVRSTPQAGFADVQLYCNPLSYTTVERGRRRLMKPDPWPGFSLSFQPCRPTSRGRIDLASPDPEAAPRIRPDYLSTDADVVAVLSGARLLGRLQASRAIAALADGPPDLTLVEASDEAILDDFRARGGTVYHPCGTCRMAPEERGGAVDGRLRVHGFDNLHVCDASIFPNVTSANTNAPTIMAAWKAAPLILGA